MRWITVLVLFLYAAGVVAVTVFPIAPSPPTGEPWWDVFHYVPFVVDGASFVLNVIMFVPFGVLVPLRWAVVDSYRRVAGCALTASAAIETMQLILTLTVGSRRTVDVNDLIANTAGAVLGLLVLRLAVPHAEHRAMVSRAPGGTRPPRRPLR